MSNPYVAAGYILIWASVALYAWTLNRRIASARRVLGSVMEDDADTDTRGT